MVVIHIKFFVLERANSEPEVKLAVAHLVVEFVVPLEVVANSVVHNLDIL